MENKTEEAPPELAQKRKKGRPRKDRERLTFLIDPLNYGALQKQMLSDGLTARQVIAIELLTQLIPEAQIAGAINCNISTIRQWKSDPVFSDYFYQSALALLRGAIPSALLHQAKNLEEGKTKDLEFLLKLVGKFQEKKVVEHQFLFAENYRQELAQTGTEIVLRKLAQSRKHHADAHGARLPGNDGDGVKGRGLLNAFNNPNHSDSSSLISSSKTIEATNENDDTHKNPSILPCEIDTKSNAKVSDAEILDPPPTPPSLIYNTSLPNAGAISPTPAPEHSDFQDSETVKESITSSRDGDTVNLDKELRKEYGKELAKEVEKEMVERWVSEDEFDWEAEEERGIKSMGIKEEADDGTD